MSHVTVKKIVIKFFLQLVFNETLPWDRLGYTSVLQFLSSMPEVCELQRTSATGSWTVFVREQGKDVWVFIMLLR